MNISKTLTVAASFLIACAGVAGIRAYADTAARNAITQPAAAVETIPTLPVITVRPSPEQMRTISGRVDSVDEASAAIPDSAEFDMPYYSFAAKPVRVGKG